MGNLRSKWLTILLVVAIITSSISFPMATYASNSNFPEQTSDTSKPSAYYAKNAKHVTELVDKRDQHTKYYLNEDGSYTAETTRNSRHFQDAQGKWQDISNKLIAFDDINYSSKNEANAFGTYFAGNSSANYLAMLKSDNTEKIAWNLVGANKVEAVKDTYGVTYPEILANTDLQYQTFADGLKENIILKNKTAPNTFQFNLKTTGLEPVAQADDSIALQDTKSGQIKFVLPKPFMIDNAKQRSEDVSMTLAETQNPNVYTLTVTADSDWLNDSSRAWPVTIDPTITTQNWYTQVGSNGNDTYIASYAPNTSYYNSNYLTTGYDGVNYGTANSLIRFVLPTLPAGSIVTDGALSLYKYTTTGAQSELINALPVTSYWPYNVTWNTPLTVDTSNQYAEADQISVAGNFIGWINFNVWTIAKAWINGNLANNGIEVAYQNPNDSLFFYYSSNDPSGLGPVLSITYITDQIGVNPYWSYAGTSAGSVNTFNGNFLTSVSDFALPGRGIPIKVTRTYNSRVAVPGSGVNGVFGQNWFSNLDMQLVIKSWGAVFVDSTQTEHPFMLKSDGVSYIAPDNYPMMLYQYNQGGQTYYHLQQANETGTYQAQLPTLDFNSSGKLIKLSDGKGNVTNVAWNSGNIIVTDPSGRTVTLTQNANGTVSQITTSVESGKVKASYNYSNGYLTSVTYDNGDYPSTSISYTWSNGLINSITDRNNVKYYLSYNASNQVISVGQVNMLTNPSFEASADGAIPDNWTTGVTNDNGSVRVSNSITPSTGKKVLNINSQYQSGTTSDGYLYAKQTVLVDSNQTYTLSALQQTAGLNGIAFLNVDQLDINGNDLYLWTDTRANALTGTNTSWTPRSLTVKTSLQTRYLVVYLEVQHDNAHFNGDAYFDGVQLQVSPNILTKNQSDLEIDPSGWTASGNAGILSDTSQHWQGNASLREKTTQAGDNYVYTPQISVKPSTAYTFSSYVNIPVALTSGSAYLRIIERDANNVVVNDTGSTLSTNLNVTSGWQRLTGTLTTNVNTRSVELRLENAGSGTVYWDGIQLELAGSAGTFTNGIITDFQGHTELRYFNDTIQGQTYKASWVTTPVGDAVKYDSDNYGTPVIVVKDPQGIAAETDMTWNSGDRLTRLKLPEGGIYNYTYDAFGNMTSAKDPLNRTTSYDYYFNQLSTITQAGGDKVSTTWDPVNLNSVTSTDQALNTQGYSYDQYSNLTAQSNILGVADNRILNSDLEAGLPGNPTFSRSSSAYKQDYTVVSANTPRYETGKYNQALMVEEGTTNMLNTQGGGANNDWTKWSHWGNRSYWSSESQTLDSTYGYVYTGVNANSSATYLFDYYPYTVTSGTPYTVSVMLKLSQNWSGSTTAYINRSSDNAAVGTNTQTLNLTTSWQKVTYTITPNQSLTGSAGLGLKFTSLPAGVTVYAARPQLEQLPYATGYTDSTRSGESLTIPTSVFTPSQGTIEAWVKPQRNPQAGSQYIQMITDVAETGNKGLIMAIGSDGKFYIQAGTGTGIITATSTTVASAGNWYYVAGKWDSSGVSIYVNGTKQATTAGTPNISIDSVPTIGRESSVAYRWFDGLIDDVRISDKARSDTEVQAAYNSGQALTADSSTRYKLNLDNTLSPTMGSFQPANWTATTPSGSINHIEYDSSAPFGGSNVLHLKGGPSGTVSQSTDFIDLTGTNDFIISGYIKTSGASTDGAYINVTWYDSTQTHLIRNDQNFAAKNTSWQKLLLTLSPPTTPNYPYNAAYAKISLVVPGQFDAYFDNIQFEKSPMARDYNYLDNSSFERGSLQWLSSDTNTATIVNDGLASYSGNYDAQINRSTSGSAYFESQSVINVVAGQDYTLSGHILTSPGFSAAAGSGASLRYYLYDSNGNLLNNQFTDINGNLITNQFTTPVYKPGNNWAKFVTSFRPKVNGVLKIRLEVNNASGLAKFDNIRLSPGNDQITMSYESTNNYAKTITDQLGHQATVNTFNPYGLALSVTTPGDQNMASSTMTSSYDGLNQLRSVTDNAGNIANYVLDNNGNVVEASLNGGSKTYDHSRFAYDSLNNLIQETDISYDAQGNEVDSITKYQYDASGRIIQKTNPDGTANTIAYDSLGNLVGISFPDKQYLFSYNKDGRRTGATLKSGGTIVKTYSYSYDAYGHLLTNTETNGPSSPIPDTAPLNVSITTANYNDLDQLLEYDLNLNGTILQYKFNYLKNGLVQKFTVDGKDYLPKFDEAGQLISDKKPNSTEDDFSYDAAGRILTSQTNKITSLNGSDGKLVPITSSTYSYNDNGTLKSVTGNGPGSPSAAYIYNNATEKLSRLTQAEINDGTYNKTFNYTFDPAGNLLTMNAANGTQDPISQTFTYDADNKITAINGNANAVSYDANGNLKKLTFNGTTRYYTYDGANRLIAVGTSTLNIADIASFTYDIDGNRLTKTVGSITTTYHYFQGKLQYETLNGDPANKIHALYAWSPNGRLEAVSLDYVTGQTNTWYYYHYNARGDVIAVTDANGNLYRQYVYDPYGNVISVKDGGGDPVDITNDPGFNNAYTYAGYRYDAETGLYFLNARYYAAGIGRFLTKDTWNGSATDPKSLNHYAYGEGDPVNLVDPSGHDVGWAQLGNNAYPGMSDNEEGSTGETNSPVLLGLAGSRWHSDYDLNNRKYLHWEDGKYDLRFNSNGKLVQHSGKVIGEPKGGEIKILGLLKKANPKFFSGPKNLIPIFYIPIDIQNFGLNVT